jgi:hypothetical protein
MGRVLSDRIDYGAAEHVKSVLRCRGFAILRAATVVADKLGIAARFRFYDAIGDHRRRIWLGHTYLSIGVGSYSTPNLLCRKMASTVRRPMQRSPLPKWVQAATPGARNAGSGIDVASAAHRTPDKDRHQSSDLPRQDADHQKDLDQIRITTIQGSSRRELGDPSVVQRRSPGMFDETTASRRHDTRSIN